MSNSLIMENAKIENIVLEYNPNYNTIEGLTFTDWLKEYTPRIDFTVKEKEVSISRIASNRSDKTPLSPNVNYFIYLDVGVWAGDKRYFGIVYKKCVLLCKFNYKQAHIPIVPSDIFSITDPIFHEFWSHFGHYSDIHFDWSDQGEPITKKVGGAIEIVKWAEIIENPPQSNSIYIFLPDMHLPKIRYRDEFKDITQTELNQMYDSHNKDIARGIPSSQKYIRYQEYIQSIEADIFKNAGESLVCFLDLVISFIVKNKYFDKVKVIQIGDLYELWQNIGAIGTFFDDSKEGLILEDDAVTKLMDRITGIEAQNYSIISRFNVLEKFGIITYLHGNHDAYLLDIMRSKDNKWDEALGFRKARMAYFYEDNIFAEHGHRLEAVNKDGNWQGAFIADLAYLVPEFRSLELVWQRIMNFIGDSQTTINKKLIAIDLLYSELKDKKPKFSVFIMGHSHVPDLCEIHWYLKKNLGLRPIIASI